MLFEYPITSATILTGILVYFFMIIKMFNDQNKEWMVQTILGITGAIITMLILRWILKDD